MTQATTTLPQLANTVEIVGTLKELDLERKKSAKGNWYVKGTVTVVSKTTDKVHEHRINVMVMESSKLIKGINTMMSEYKSIEAVGEEAADRIKVIGEIELEEYYNKQNEFVSFNKTKGVFFHRLEADDVQPDKAIASIEVIVKSFAPFIDQETGEILHHTVNAFSVGYGERIVELKKTIVSDKLHDAMANLYENGSTGRLTFKLNSYAEKAETTPQETPVSMSHGFGSDEVVEQNRVFERRVQNLEITGGDLPFEEPKAFTEEMIQAAERKLALKREELKQEAATKASATPQENKPTGFGGDVDSQMPTGMTIPSEAPSLPTQTALDTAPEISDDDMPDF